MGSHETKPACRDRSLSLSLHLCYSRLQATTARETKATTHTHTATHKPGVIGSGTVTPVWLKASSS